MLTKSTEPIMRVQRQSKLGDLPVTLEEVKSFLRIENNQGDKLIEDLISAVTDYAEWHMERSLVRQTWQISCEGHIPRRIYLKYGPVTSIRLISATMSNSESRNPGYYFSDIGNYIELKDYFNAVRVDIQYEAGYQNVPEQIKLGLIQHVSALYKDREIDIGSHLTEVKKFYSPFRELRVIL